VLVLFIVSKLLKVSEYCENKKILISPLSWGLGHAVRLIPVIKLLLDNNFEIIVATTPELKILLNKEFPNIEFIIFPSVNIKYFGRNATLAISLQLPKFFFSSLYEKKMLSQILNNREIDLIISDNRYGFYSKQVPSVFMTHQVSVKMPFGFGFIEKMFYKLHCKFINNFDLCLIPDNSGEHNISGDLTHKFKLPKKSHFIGTLSRFNKHGTGNDKQTIFDIIFVLSGPEPQRTIFEKIILLESQKYTNLKMMLVRGKVQGDLIASTKSFSVVNYLPAEELSIAISQSRVVVCRSGYTSLMDLVALNKKAILVPTPGQTEQEYLAGYLSSKGVFARISQNEFSIQQVLIQSENLNQDFVNFSQENELIIPLINSLLK